MSEELAEDVTDAIKASKDIDFSHLATKADLFELKAEMKADNVKIIMWMVGISFAQAAMILSILRLH